MTVHVCGWVETQLAHNILRTICFLELGESVVVLWFFCIQPSGNGAGYLASTEIPTSENHTEFQNFSIMFPTGFLMVLFKVMFSNCSGNIKKQRSSVGVSVLQHNIFCWIPHGSI
jgi:hypothetical protein